MMGMDAGGESVFPAPSFQFRLRCRERVSWKLKVEHQPIVGHVELIAIEI
jgi:hypothetical protein